MRRLTFVAVLSSLALGSPVAAQGIPQSIRIQGYLSDRAGGPPVPANGTYTMTFQIFDVVAGGAPLATAGPAPVVVTNGVYEVAIPVGASVFSGSSRYLQITVNDEILTPRLPIDSTPFALRSESADTVAPGAVTTPGLAEGAVTASKIGVPCGEGQILVRTGGAWTCATPPAAAQVCFDGSLLPCYSGPAGTLNIGACRAGVSTCKPDGTGFNACAGAVTPGTEVCDAVDNDCDGQVDDGGVCATTVTTSPATLVTSSSATLNGSASPNGSVTTGWFRYSTTNPGTCNDVFGTRAPASGGTALGSGSSPVAYVEPISNLAAGTTYYFCAIASNAGMSFGAVLSFTTSFQPPTVTTSAATLVTSSSATLNGSANPNGNATTGWFRYSTTSPPGGCNDSFGTRVPSFGGTALGSASGPVAYAESISSLIPGNTYYVCAIASNVQGTRFGTVVPFTTVGTPPTVTTGTPTSVTLNSATLTGSANPNGGGTTGWFRYSTTDPGTCNDTFGTRVPSSGGTALGSGTSGVGYSNAISGLSSNTTYYVCAIASNPSGTSFGAVVSFNTSLTPPTVTTSAATSVTSSSATLNGSANPNGNATTAWFRYSLSNPGTCNDSFGTRAPGAGGTSMGSGTSDAAYSRSITGLLGEATYYFCAIANNSAGTSFGAVLSFTTPSP